MKVAFTIFGGDGWTGGTNYLKNLLSAARELSHGEVEPILFHAPEADAKTLAILRPWLSCDPIVVPGWSSKPAARLTRLWGAVVCQRDFVSEAAFRQAGVDVVFQHSAWYGAAFPLPTLAWIADFQHKHLPGMFSTANNIKRDLGYLALSWFARRIMVSSEDARADAERFFPRSRGRIAVLPFCVKLHESALQLDPAEVAGQYQLPARYYYLPNQFWKHKNHLGLVEALRLLQQQKSDIVVAVSGNPKDGRNPEYPGQVLQLVKDYGLEQSFRFLGMVPYEHIMPLMRGSQAVINPSFFEGWSTTVEEAKLLGVPLLLSDLGVHREQAEGIASFFDPHDPKSIAACLAAKWASPESTAEARAIAAYARKREEFAQRFYAILCETAGRPIRLAGIES